MSLLDQMSFAQRDAWLNIYNDFLQSQQKTQIKAEQGSEMIGDQEPLIHQHLYDRVTSNEDFFELFRDWQIKELPLEIEDLRDLALLDRSKQPTYLDEDGNKKQMRMNMKDIASQVDMYVAKETMAWSKVDESNVYVTDEEEFLATAQ